MAEETSATSAPAAAASAEPTKEVSLGNGEVTMDDATAGSDKPDDTAQGEGTSDTTANDTAKPAPTEPAAAGNSEQAESREEDAVMVDAHGPSATNGTPASSKKASSGSAKKKGSSVPEHKSKKLNRKKSKLLTHLDAKAGEYYLARMKGHPPWPSVICDEEMLPESLVSTRPVTTPLPDGSFRKAEYAPGGKRAHERTFPIMFLHTNEFAWMPNTDLASISTEEAENPSEKGKSKVLLEAYKKAAERLDLADLKKMLSDHTAAVQAEEEAQAEREAQKAEKAAKAAKRKSTASAAAADHDEMDVDNVVADEKPKNKKRKKSLADVDDAEEKPAKTPKTGGKLKLTAPKTPATDSKPKKATKSKTSKKTGAAADSSSESSSAKPEERPLTEAEIKEKKEKTVLYYRHKLQRGFLSRDSVPKEEEMKSMSDFLSELETHHDLEGAIIRATKIHKVLKAMMKLPSIPLDEEYKFKDRSHALLQKWNEILGGEAGAAAGGAAGDEKEESGKEGKEDVPATKDTGGENGKAESNGEVKAAVAEDEKPEDVANKIGTVAEGEKEADLAEPAKDAAPTAKDDAETKDAPNVENAPEKEHKPPAVETADEPAA